MLLAFLFFLGLFVGSFLNVVIYRVPRNESIAYPPSHCPHCRKKIAPYDLIPVFSYLFLKGKCRNCHSHISLQYPVVELITGILFVFALTHVGSMYQVGSSMHFITLLFYLFSVSSLVTIFLIDLKHGIIPFKVLFPAIVVTFLYLLLTTNYLLLVHVLSALGAFSFFLVIFLVTKGRGMGFGDVVYALFMGLFLGFPSIVYGLYIAFLTGTAVSLILIVVGRKHLKGSTIAFGPFLVIGTLALLFWEQHISMVALRLIGF